MSDRLYITDQDGNTLRIDGATRVKTEPPRRSTLVTVYFESRSETVLDEVSSETAQQARDAIHHLLVTSQGTVDLRAFKHGSSPSPAAPAAPHAPSSNDVSGAGIGDVSRERSRSVHRTTGTMRAFSLLLALLVSALPVYAQTDEEEALIIQEVIEASMGESAVGPEAAENALGEIRTGLLGLNLDELDVLEGFTLNDQGNLALLRQEGSGNQALIDQQGTGNLAALLQLGNGITTTATQIGDGNVFGVRLEGNDLVLGPDGVTQIGDHNVYLLEYTGSARQIAPTTQIGDGNQAVQVGGIAVPFGVEQYGDGMRMIIRHNGAQ